MRAGREGLDVARAAAEDVVEALAIEGASAAIEGASAAIEGVTAPFGVTLTSGEAAAPARSCADEFASEAGPSREANAAIPRPAHTIATTIAAPARRPPDAFIVGVVVTTEAT